jgi:Uncharacterized conserved protein (COG2071)
MSFSDTPRLSETRLPDKERIENMRFPTIHGVIDRRVLVNFRVDARVMADFLPPPFRPVLVNGYAIAGICLIRLKQVRPSFVPFPWGLTSGNAAHRIAVEWETDGGCQQGVFIPRRDSDSWLNYVAGGWLFPGEHHRASFTVSETADRLAIAMNSDDGLASVSVDASVGDRMPGSSVFESIDDASAFFKAGALGYSATREPGIYDALELRCQNWHVAPLAVEKVSSSFFDDRQFFPAGSVEFDCALLMRNIRHRWVGHESMCCSGHSGVADALVSQYAESARLE